MRFQAPESLSEQIAQHLGQQIITGMMRPGERIQELKVAGDLDVSRGSVREALLILERRHLIHIYPRKGAVVSALTPDLVNSLYDIYMHLLLMLADKFMEQKGSVDPEPLLAAVRDLRNRITAPDATIEEIIEGGMGIMRKCFPIVNNPYLEETLENFRPAISRTYYLVLERNREETRVSEEFFARIGDRVAADDRDGVMAAIRDFGEHQRRVALDALEKDESLSLETAN